MTYIHTYMCLQLNQIPEQKYKHMYIYIYRYIYFWMNKSLGSGEPRPIQKDGKVLERHTRNRKTAERGEGGIRGKNPVRFFLVERMCVWRRPFLRIAFDPREPETKWSVFVFFLLAKVCWAYLEHHEQLSRPTSDRARCATTLGHNGFFSCWRSELESVFL